MPPPVFCSLASSRHRPAAIACLLSIREHHPDAELVLLAVDGGPLPAEARRIRQVALDHAVPADALADMRRRYSVAELCFAAKPYVIGRLLDEGASEVHYLDGDCRVYASCDPLRQSLAQADLLLTPHALTPVPDDGRTPRPLTVLRGGVFNGGYLGVRATPEGRRFTHWLAAMTRHYARNAPDAGMCGDQRWLDLVPVLFAGAAICRHPGANVAYWNLHERTLTRDAGGYRVNGEPLLFFHFSGYRPHHPAELSVHQNRHAVAPGSPLAALLEDYRRRLPEPAAPSGRLARLRRLLPVRP